MGGSCFILLSPFFFLLCFCAFFLLVCFFLLFCFFAFFLLCCVFAFLLVCFLFFLLFVIFAFFAFLLFACLLLAFGLLSMAFGGIFSMSNLHIFQCTSLHGLY